MGTIKIRIDTKNIILYLLLIAILFITFNNDIGPLHSKVLVLFSVFLVIAICNLYEYLDNESVKLFIAMIIFLGIVFIYYFSKISSCDLQWPVRYLDWIIANVIGIISFYLFTDNQKKYLLYITYFACMFGVFLIFYKGRIAINQSIYNGVYIAEATQTNTMVAFIGVCLIWLLNSTKLIDKILSIIGILLCLYCNVVILQRALALIFSILMISVVLIFNYKRTWKRYLIYGVIIILAIYLLHFGYINKVIDFFLPFVKSNRMIHRLVELKAFISGNSTHAVASSGTARVDLIWNSLCTWLENPINFFVGVGDHRESNNIIGNHSEIIDNLARYGVLGSVILYAILIGLLKHIKLFETMDKDSALYRQCTAVYIVMILRNFLGNALTYQIAFVMFLFCPLVVKKCNMDRKLLRRKE